MNVGRGLESSSFSLLYGESAREGKLYSRAREHVRQCRRAAGGHPNTLICFEKKGSEYMVLIIVQGVELAEKKPIFPSMGCILRMPLEPDLKNMVSWPSLQQSSSLFKILRWVRGSDAREGGREAGWRWQEIRLDATSGWGATQQSKITLELYSMSWLGVGENAYFFRADNNQTRV